MCDDPCEEKGVFRTTPFTKSNNLFHDKEENKTNTDHSSELGTKNAM